MGIAERKEREKTELREKILDAARTIVLEHGFEELTMRKVADAIEYSPGTIYLHFASRDDIAIALCRESFTRLLGAMAPAAAITDPYERVFAIGRAYVDFAMANTEAYRLIFMLDPKFSNVVMSSKHNDPDEPGQQAYGVLFDTVSELIASGRFKAVDPDTAAQVLWCGLHGIVSLRLCCPEFEFAPTSEVADLMQSALMHGLMKTP
jgi:AcrR family transcriptional regulator